VFSGDAPLIDDFTPGALETLAIPDASNMIWVRVLDAKEGGQFPLPEGIDLADFPIVDIFAGAL